MLVYATKRIEVAFWGLKFLNCNHELCRDLVQLLGAAVAGIHAMTDEHFGISIVEYMAAGAIPIGSFFTSTSLYNLNVHLKRILLFCQQAKEAMIIV